MRGNFEGTRNRVIDGCSRGGGRRLCKEDVWWIVDLNNNCFLAYCVVRTTVQQTETLHIKASCQRVPATDRCRSRGDKQPLEVARRCPDPLLTVGHEKGRRLKKFPKLFPGCGWFHQHQVMFSNALTTWFDCEMLHIILI